MRWFLLSIFGAKYSPAHPLGVICCHKRWETVICSGSLASAVVHSLDHWFELLLVSDWLNAIEWEFYGLWRVGIHSFLLSLLLDLAENQCIYLSSMAKLFFSVTWVFLFVCHSFQEPGCCFSLKLKYEHMPSNMRLRCQRASVCFLQMPLSCTDLWMEPWGFQLRAESEMEWMQA